MEKKIAGGATNKTTKMVFYVTRLCYVLPLASQPKESQSSFRQFSIDIKKKIVRFKR